MCRLARTVPIALVALLWVGAGLACEDSKRAAQSTRPESGRLATGKSSPEPADEQIYGRWKGLTTCLELYRTGDFKLSTLNRGPKFELRGTVVQRRLAQAQVELSLRPNRIKRSRWISKCRKEVRSAKLFDSHKVLNTEFTTSSTSTLRLRKLSDDKVELCGERCEVLTAEAAFLTGEWRDPGLQRPREPSASWVPGQLLGLKLNSRYPELWVGGAAGAYYVVHAAVTRKTLGPELFELSFTASRVRVRPAKSEQEPAPEELGLLGGQLRVQVPLKMTAQRVKGGLRICRDVSHCSELPELHDL